MATFIEDIKSKLSDRTLKLTGLFLMAGTGILFTISDSLVQYISMQASNRHQHLSAFQVMFIRSFVQTILCVIIMIIGRVHPYGEKGAVRNLLSMIGLGLLENGGIISFYFALQYMPVGDAVVIRFTSPVFTALIAFFALKTKCSFCDIVFGAISFFGVVMVARPEWFIEPGTHLVSLPTSSPMSSNETIAAHSHLNLTQFSAGAGLALSSALFLSAFYVLLKYLGGTFNLILMVLYPCTSGVLISVLGMIAVKDKVLLSEIAAVEWFLLVFIGLMTFAAMLLMAASLQLEDAGPLVLIRNLDVIYAFIIQVVLLKISLTWATAGGAIIVICATSLIMLNRVIDFSRLCTGGKDETPSGEGYQMVDESDKDGDDDVEIFNAAND